MKISVAITSCVTAIALCAAAPAIGGDIKSEILQRRVTVTDGDTLRMGPFRIRLFGIDAPEQQQTCRTTQTWHCGIAAKDALIELIRDEPVRCDVQDIDRYDRAVAICHVRDLELNAELVRAGMAVATPQYSRRYMSLQDEARRGKRGLWASKFQMPEEYRRDRR